MSPPSRFLSPAKSAGGEGEGGLGPLPGFSLGKLIHTRYPMLRNVASITRVIGKKKEAWLAFSIFFSLAYMAGGSGVYGRTMRHGPGVQMGSSQILSVVAVGSVWIKTAVGGRSEPCNVGKKNCSFYLTFKNRIMAETISTPLTKLLGIKYPVILAGMNVVAGNTVVPWTPARARLRTASCPSLRGFSSIVLRLPCSCTALPDGPAFRTSGRSKGRRRVP